MSKRKISAEERKAAAGALKLIEFVDSTGQDLSCFEFVYNGGNKDGKTAKVIVVIENEEMEQIES